MSVNLEWGVRHTIVSPEGSLDLNVPICGVLLSGRAALFLLKPNPYKIVPGFRKTTADISQADGSSPQPPYLTGLVAYLYVEYWTQQDPNEDTSDRAPACEADLRQMDELLTLHLNALRVYAADPDDQQRLVWYPEGYGDTRLIDSVLLDTWEDPEPFDASGGIGFSVTFSLATPFPYAIDGTEIDTTIDDGSSGTITNAGNAQQSMVTRTHGPSSGFVIENTDTGELVSYSDASDPGALTIPSGHYVEIDWFLGTATLSGGSGTDVIAGIDPEATTYWKLRPGVNNIAVTGGDTDFLSNNAVL